MDNRIYPTAQVTSLKVIYQTSCSSPGATKGLTELISHMHLYDQGSCLRFKTFSIDFLLWKRTEQYNQPAIASSLTFIILLYSYWGGIKYSKNLFGSIFCFNACTFMFSHIIFRQYLQLKSCKPKTCFVARLITPSE